MKVKASSLALHLDNRRYKQGLQQEMASTSTKKIRRIASLLRLRNRQETPYQAWGQDQDDQVQIVDGSPVDQSSNSVVEFPLLTPSPGPSPTMEAPVERVLKLGSQQGEHVLIECFYLGSTSMTGMEIKGRGCIDIPAALIWELSQQDKKPRRMNSWPTRHHQDLSSAAGTNPFKPRYVKLVTGSGALQVLDNSTGELITQFSYRKISFVGTHPKYTRLFAFVAEASSPEPTAPFCHAFKCEDKGCAKQAACSLSDLFYKKIQELLQSQKTGVTSTQTTVLPT